MTTTIELNRALYDDADNHQARFIAKPGLSREVVELISKSKNEPQWMLDKRLKGLELFQKTPLPTWGPDLSQLHFDQIVFYVDPNTKETNNNMVLLLDMCIHPK